MPDIDKQEVVARGIIKEAPTPAGVSPETQQAIDILQKTLEEKGAEEAFRAVATQIREADVDKAIDANIKDASSKLNSEAKNKAKVIRVFLNEGFVNVDNADKPQIIAAVQRAIAQRPRLQQEINNIAAAGAASAEEVAKRILQDVDLSSELRALFEQYIDADNAISDNIDQLEEEKTSLTTEEARKNTEKGNLEVELQQVNNELALFDNGSGIATGTPGAKYTEREGLVSKIPELEREVRERKQEMDAYDKGLETLLEQRKNLIVSNRDTAALDEQIERLREERQKAQDKHDEAQKKLKRIEELNQQENNLKERKTTLETRLEELKKEIDDLNRSLKEKQDEITKAKTKRKEDEQEYFDNIDRIFYDATDAYLEKLVEKSMREANRIIEEIKDKTKDPDELKILDAVESRYDTTRTIKIGLRRKEKKVPHIKEKQVADDFAVFMDKGERGLLEKILKEGLNPKTDAAKIAEIDAKLDDPEWVTRNAKPLLERLVTRRIQTAKLHPEEIRYIVESKWGKELIDTAAKKRKDIRDAIDAIAGDVGLDIGYWDRVKRMSGGNLIKLLLLILGTGVLITPLLVGSQSMREGQ